MRFLQNGEKRLEIIENVLRDLESLKKTEGFENRYAIEKNIEFFNAIKSPFTYINWLIKRAPKIDGKRLLELTDFPFPKWDKALHLKLIEMEKKDFTGLLPPLRKTLINFIIKTNPNVLVNLGCGGMEIERQLIKRLLDMKYPRGLIFIGIDKSDISIEMAKNNLNEISGYIEIKEFNNLDQKTLNQIKKLVTDKHQIILCKNNIFELDKFFNKDSFDLIFYTRFRHHLSENEKASLEKVLIKLTNRIVEHDDYKNWFEFIPQSIFTWMFPVLMNGAILSRLRSPAKKELLEREKNGWHIKFFRTNAYLAEFEK